MHDKYNYTLELNWLGDENGMHHRTDRFYEIRIEGKATLKGSADKPFFGDPTLYNPEDLLLSALTSCHMMSYLYVCGQNQIEVLTYSDNSVGYLEVEGSGKGGFTSVELNPIVTIKNEQNLALAKELHAKANELCFIANSCNFPIHHKAKISKD